MLVDGVLFVLFALVVVDALVDVDVLGVVEVLGVVDGAGVAVSVGVVVALGVDGVLDAPDATVASPAAVFAGPTSSVTYSTLGDPNLCAGDGRIVRRAGDSCVRSANCATVTGGETVIPDTSA